MTGWQDVRYGLRMMSRSPAFTAVVVLSLALGIGANTAVFSLTNAVMLQLLPVRHPEQLVELLNKYPGEPRGSYFSLGSYEYYRQHNHVFSGLIAVHPSRLRARAAASETEMVTGEFVSSSFFPVLGLKPAVGRLIGPEDDRPDATIAVLSWSCWKNRFGLDPAVLGSAIVVDDMPLTVAGVAPRDFSGLQVGAAPDLWIPLALEPAMHHPSEIGRGGMGLIGRLKPGVSIDQARAEMSVLFRWTVEERSRFSGDPLMRQLRFEMEPAGAGFSVIRDRFSRPLLVLMSIVAVLLLIACTNIATMLLARAATRRREMALRISLGAGRLRIVRQVFTESLLLSGAAGLLGAWLAYLGAGALVALLVSGRPIPGMPPVLEIDVRPDFHVLLFTAGVALLTGLLFGSAPAWTAAESRLGPSLRESGTARETRAHRFFGKSLVTVQVALSVALLSAAGLFAGYLAHLERLDAGFRRDHVLLVTLDPSRGGYTGPQLSRAYQEFLAALKRIPGVQSATISAPTPVSGAGASRFGTVEGSRERPEDRRYISLSWVAPEYFKTLGTPLLVGRDFSLSDAGRPPVVVVNQAFARRYFAGRNPIGKHVTLDGDDWRYEIIGVAGDAKYYDLREPALATMYLNTFQSPGPESDFALRTTVDPMAVVPAVRRTVREMLKATSVARVSSLEEQVDASIVPERAMAALSGVFAFLGAVLAAIGLYGLVAYSVARRIPEIGVRMALGATARQVTRMVLLDALGMLAAGLAIGAGVAFWAKNLAASAIEGLPHAIGGPIGFGAAAMAAVALVAAVLPARRAARVDPIAALRHE